MIRRNGSKATPSLVNAATEEHLSVAQSVRDDKPVTNLNNAFSCINFDNKEDGSFAIRKPLVLKDKYASNIIKQLYLFDNETLLYFKVENNTRKISLNNVHNLNLVWHDVNLQECSYKISSATIPFIIEIYNYIHTLDGTILATKIDHSAFSSFTNSQLVASGLNYDNLIYRFIKVYKNPDIYDTWNIEILNTEYNTITSSTDTTSSTLDINLLLENPYAIRDMYNSGSNSTTKIVAYKVQGIDSTNLRLKSVQWLTEALPGAYNSPKIIVSDNAYGGNNLTVLKAFIRTTNTPSTLKFYGCWEYSTDGGISWAVEPKFLEYWTNKIEIKRVSELDNAEFEDLLYSESVEKTANYLLNKSVVALNPNAALTDIIGERPDVLILTENVNYLYRFQVYVDTGKLPAIEGVTPGNVDSATFTLLSKDSYHNLDTSGSFKYKTSKGNGHTYTTTIAITAKQYKVLNTTMINGKECILTGLVGTKILDANIPEFVHNPYATTEYNVQSGNIYRSSPGPEVTSVNRTLYTTLDGVHASNIPYTCTLYKIKNSNQYLYVSGLPSSIEIDTPISVSIHVPTAIDDDPSLSGNIIILHPGFDNKIGNFFEIIPSAETHIMTKITVELDTIPEDFTSVIGFTTSSVDSNTLINSLQQTQQVTSSTNTYTFDTEGVEFNQVNIVCATNAAFNVSEGTISNTDNYLHIKKITVYYNEDNTTKVTSTYISTFTGAFQIPYTQNTILVSSLDKYRQDLFKGELVYYKEQLLSYKDYSLYFSNANSITFNLMNTITFGSKISKVIKWRDYIIVFTTADIHLLAYDSNSGTYTSKIISSVLGLPMADANTVTTILNSVYFKSNTKIYKLVPNLYASDDDILNLSIISEGINTLLEDLLGKYIDTNNFQYSDSERYNIFLPLNNSTWCFRYHYINKLWTIYKYPILLNGIENLSIDKAYLKGSKGLYYFNNTPHEILTNNVIRNVIRYGGKTSDNTTYFAFKGTYIENNVTKTLDIYGITESTKNLYELYDYLPYSDYLDRTPIELSTEINTRIETNPAITPVDLANGLNTPIQFEIDFGQKSSNYTLEKQFLESKLLFAVFNSKETLPISIDIETDGEGMSNNRIHVDANTSSAFWKENANQYGTLNSIFDFNKATNHSGIVRQFIIKYSGRGKTIRHLISGNAIMEFSFYSLNYRYRLLPVKQ